MQQRVEEYLLDIVVGKRCNLLDKIVLLVLSVLEIVYIFLVKLRELLYRLNILQSKELECRVISVGNISAGGTGKTPVVERLARMIKKQGESVVVISRGYGSGTKGPLVVSDGHKIQADVNEAGDEVYMLARHLPDVPVVIGKDRWQAGKLAEERFEPDIIILDDGFQHWQLKRDVNVVTIDAMNPFGYYHLIPRGLLREPLSALKRADVFVLSKTDHVSSEQIKEIKERIRSYNQKAEIFTSRHQPLYVQSLTSQEDSKYSTDELKGKKVLALSGIGNPESFVEGLRKLEADVIDSIIFPDHYKYEEQDLMDIAVQAQLSEVDWVITTEKDAVKFTEDMISRFRKLGVGIFTLGIELELLEKKQLVKEMF